MLGAGAPPGAEAPARGAGADFYTDVMLGTKELLRRSQRKRLAQCRHAAPPLAAQADQPLEAPRKRRSLARAGGAVVSGRALASWDDVPPKPAEEPSAEAAKKSGALLGLLGLAKKKPKRSHSHFDQPPDVSDERWGLTAQSAARSGTAALDNPGCLPPLEGAADASEALAPPPPPRRGPRAVSREADACSRKVADALAARRRRSAFGELPSLAGDTSGAGPTAKYDELPSIQSVEQTLALARKTAAHAAKIAIKALDEEAERANKTSGFSGKVVVGGQEPAASPKKRSKAFDPAKGQKWHKHVGSVYREDQASALKPRRKTVLEAAASKPVAIALDELVTSAAVRWRHRDEKNREDRYRGYAAALAAAEAAALESGKQLNPDDVPEVRRHPVYLRIEHLAASDIARAVAKARDVDGSVDGVGRVFDLCLDNFERLRRELLAHPTVDRGLHALSGAANAAAAARAVAAVAAAPVFIPPTVLPPPVAPRLPQLECLVDGVDVELRGADFHDERLACRVWVHRRRRRTDRRSEDFRPWTWRFTVYELATGRIRRVTASEAAALAAAEKAVGFSGYAEKEREGAELEKRARLAEAGELRDVFHFEEDPDQAILPFDVEALPRYEARRKVVEEDYRCSLVEGCAARGSRARAAALGPIAETILPLLKLERRRGSTKEFLGCAREAYARALDLAEAKGRVGVTAIDLWDALSLNKGRLAKELNLPHEVFLNLPHQGFQKPLPDFALARKVFAGLRGVVPRPASARDRGLARAFPDQRDDAPAPGEPGRLYALARVPLHRRSPRTPDGRRTASRERKTAMHYAEAFAGGLDAHPLGEAAAAPAAAAPAAATWFLEAQESHQPAFPAEPLSARWRTEEDAARPRPSCNVDRTVPRKVWLRWAVDRERTARAGCVDLARLVLGRGHWSKAAWQVTAVEDGADGRRVALEPGYLGIEGRGAMDCDGALGCGGATWEADEDPGDMSPLSLRICELAGDDDGKVPGVIRVGCPPTPPPAPGTGLRRLRGGHNPKSQPVGMFVKSEACSSTGMITVSIVLALDDPLAPPVVQCWHLGDATSPSPPREPFDSRVPPITAVVVRDGHFIYYDAQAACREQWTPCPAVCVVAQVPSLLRPSARCADALRGRSAAGFRQNALAPPDRADPRAKARTAPTVFGSKAAGAVEPAAWERAVAHSDQRAVEQFVRHRDPRDYAYVAAVTDDRPTGCGALDLNPRADRLPGEPTPAPEDPPDRLLRARAALRRPVPQVLAAAVHASDEENYGLGRILRRSRVAYEKDRDAIAFRKMRARQRAAVRAQLEEIVNAGKFHDMQAKITRRKLKAKALRLAAAASVGGRGVGDSERRWALRLKASRALERRGLWEKRLVETTGDVFYYNVDALSDPPRLRWDAPDPWSLLGDSPRAQPSPEKEPDNALVVAKAGPTVRFDEGADGGHLVKATGSRASTARAPTREPGPGEVGERPPSRAEEEAAAREMEALMRDEEFLDEVAHNLGLGFKPATDHRGAGGAAAPDPEMAAPWRRALDADARDEAWWSDESDEVGDVADWARHFADRHLPQDHADARVMRMMDVSEAEAVDACKEAKAFVPAFVPPVPGLGDAGWIPDPPGFGAPRWRQLEFHLKGRYWRALPRARPRRDFVARPASRVTIASDHRAWRNRDLSNSAPHLALVGIHRHTKNDRSWGEAPTDWRPPAQPPVILVEDALDDVARVLAKTRRRNDREAHHTAPIQLVQCVERGARATTTVDELVHEDELKAALKDKSVQPEKNALVERAVFAARTANLADLEECLDTFELDIESTDPAGNTLLLLVVQQNEKSVAKYLLRRGADINAQNFCGNSALHFAFGYSYDDLGNYLISKGADPDLANQDGETCYEFNKMDT